MNRVAWRYTFITSAAGDIIKRRNIRRHK